MTARDGAILFPPVAGQVVRADSALRQRTAAPANASACSGQSCRVAGSKSAPLGGGFVSLGISDKDHLRRACAIVARVLRGEAPAVIPVDQESSFELVMNLAAARHLQIEVPASVRLRANRVIE